MLKLKQSSKNQMKKFGMEGLWWAKVTSQELELNCTCKNKKKEENWIFFFSTGQFKGWAHAKWQFDKGPEEWAFLLSVPTQY